MSDIVFMENTSFFNALSFSCGKGSVALNLKTGEVSYNNCNPTESGRAFWEAVTNAYPDIKETIRREQ